MKGLLYKDFIIFRKTLFILGIIVTSILLCCITITYMRTAFAVPGEEETLGIVFTNCGLYLFAFLILPFISSQLFTPDENPACINFLFSTPKSAGGQIQSKYYFLLIVNLAILLMCFLVDTGIMLMLGEYATSCSLICMIYFCFSLILLSIRIPFAIRFGSNHSFEAQCVYMIILSAFLLIYGLFGDISFFFQEEGINIKAIRDYLQSEKVVFVLSLIPYISLLIYYLSYRISLALYRKGVENYEQ